jgi:SAM-dependent methyltransferase
MKYQPVNFTKRGDEQLEGDVKYVFDIVKSYRKGFDTLKLSPDGLSIVEIGPGSDFGAQLLLASMGAKITLADRFLAPFDPDYHSKLYAEVAKRWDGPKKELEAAIRGGYKATSLRLVPEQAENMKSIPDASADFIFSNAVLEHVADARAVTSELARISKPGGTGMHQIDWRNHRDFSRPLEHLVMPEEEFQDTAPKNAYDFGNRLRMIEFRAYFEAAGFVVTEEHVDSIVDGAYLTEVLPRIRGSNSIYRFWPEDDLRRIGGCLFVRRETGKEEVVTRSRGADLLSLIASLKTSSQEQYQALARYHRLTEADRRISELSRNIDNAQKLAEMDSLVKDMLQSTSWRITAPLRWVRGLFSK